MPVVIFHRPGDTGWSGWEGFLFHATNAIAFFIGIFHAVRACMPMCAKSGICRPALEGGREGGRRKDYPSPNVCVCVGKACVWWGKREVVGGAARRVVGKRQERVGEGREEEQEVQVRRQQAAAGRQEGSPLPDLISE